MLLNDHLTKRSLHRCNRGPHRLAVELFGVQHPLLCLLACLPYRNGRDGRCVCSDHRVADNPGCSRSISSKGSSESTPPPALDELDIEPDNMRAALGWFRSLNRAGEGLALAVALSPFWILCGHYGEARAWLEAFLGPTEIAEPFSAAFPLDTDVAGDTALATRRALGLRFLATAAARQGDYVRARTYHEVGVALWRALGNPVELAFALPCSAWSCDCPATASAQWRFCQNV